MDTNSSLDPLVELAKKYAIEIREALVTIKDRMQNLGSDLSGAVCRSIQLLPPFGTIKKVTVPCASGISYPSARMS